MIPVMAVWGRSNGGMGTAARRRAVGVGCLTVARLGCEGAQEEALIGGEQGWDGLVRGAGMQQPQTSVTSIPTAAAAAIAAGIRNVIVEGRQTKAARALKNLMKKN